MEKSRTLIPLNYFYDERILSLEKEQLFSNSWIFACFKRDVANNGDYFTLDFLGVSIVIRNFSGTLCAFQNVCLHRFSKICLHEKGNGLFQCPYHGWTYNQEGKPYAIPGKKNFESKEVDQLRLKQFELIVIGEFVFLKLSESADAPPEHFFDKETHTFLLTVSEALGESIDVNKMTINANWKLIVENTLEGYHVQQVHPQSLYPLNIQRSSYAFNGYHSTEYVDFAATLSHSKKLDAVYAARSWKLDNYIQQLIFPNLTIASAYGATISIQQILPIAANEAKFISYVFAAKLPETNHALIRAFNQNAVDFNRRVFAEDKTVCEAVQQGIKQMDQRQGFFSSQEERVWFFEKNYMNCLKEDC